MSPAHLQLQLPCAGAAAPPVEPAYLPAPCPQCGSSTLARWAFRSSDHLRYVWACHGPDGNVECDFELTAFTITDTSSRRMLVKLSTQVDHHHRMLIAAIEGEIITAGWTVVREIEVTSLTRDPDEKVARRSAKLVSNKR